MMVGSLQPGAKVKLSVWRKGEEKTIQATLGELAPEVSPQAKQQDEAAPQNFQFGKLGLTVTELTARQRTELGLNGGLLVQKAQGAAARSGLQHGDVIMGLNQNEITSVKSFEKALSSAHGKIALLVRRQDSTLFVPLRLD
jgi:serine protease Do